MKVILRLTSLLILVVVQGNIVKAQSDSTIIGKVSFLTSSNIYVRFTNTKPIQIGDTLKIKIGENMRACLIVMAKSSQSLVTNSINGCNLKKDALVSFSFSPEMENKPETDDNKLAELPLATNLVENATNQKAIIPQTNSSKKASVVGKQKVSGRISLATYSRLSNVENASRHRTAARVSFNIRNIADSKFSLESYFNYTKNLVSNSSPGYRTDFPRIYNLALIYKPTEKTTVLLGRKINNKLPNIGAVDGLQIEQFIGKNFFVGGIAGYRPDVFNYGINTNLFQFGAFAGVKNQSKSLRSQTTIGFIQQSNTGAIDRRYATFQHSSTFWSDLSLFASGEMELYQKADSSAATNNARLTSLFTSVNYRFNSRISLMLSYDTRKNIIFYQSFSAENINRLIADDPSRQGLRARLNFRVFKYLYLGGGVGQRSQSDGEAKSDNLHGFITYSRLPWIGGRLNANYNINTSNYLESISYAGRYSRQIIPRVLDGEIYFRRLEYRYVERNIQDDPQHYYGAHFSIRASKKLTFGILGEYSMRKLDPAGPGNITSEENLRINFNAIVRF